MGFEMQVVANTPLVGEEDPELVAKKFFEQIGYLSKGADPDIPFKLFNDFFIKHPSKAWFVDELSATLITSKPTVYRHPGYLFLCINDRPLLALSSRMHSEPL